ncbi:hypothetical protein FYK55_15160 [Roseiconus nitratireducens]|uniref:Transposase IS200-like domain-containing protein n=1 Tax=Roseiconus nitratireducens TaxID=2605748 RepID=A0A5M6D5X3_9BACT|nr:transposase [Roseiconus nitratireducens]KAA5542146.1 hypothetical protein FYK55_15160 [Roseiconus nitratireducens]
MANPVSGKALAAGPMNSDPFTLFITWTTYGTWLPGDYRGWRKRKTGEQPPQPLLADWCRNRLKEPAVFLDPRQRIAVNDRIRQHAAIRNWELHAVSVRSNHVHVVVTACVTPKRVRDQFKANATTALRRMRDPMTRQRVWTKGGDIILIDRDDDLQRAVTYVMEAQDRMDRGK